MKYLIINADDFGMSEEVNKGIEKGIEAGVITSVSVMVNMPFFDKAMKYLKKHPEVSVGLHFNITEGSPVSIPNNVSSFIREDGNFFYWQGLTINLLLRSVDLKQVEAELNAQYIKLKKTGIKISHVDSHHHIHLYPALFDLVIRFVDKNHIAALRCRAFQLKRLLFSLNKLHSVKQLIILILCFINNRFFKNRKQYYDVVQLYDINWERDFDEKKFLQLLRDLPDGITEIITHPAIISKMGNLKFLEPRYKGLKLLLNPKVRKLAREYNIEYIKRN